MFYPGLAHDLGPFVINRKTGWEIEDVDGNVYLDFISAMASVPFGAARPDVVEPVIEALRRYGSEDTHYYSNEYVLPLAEELLRVAPDGMTRVDIALNGTEAVETAIRFMRRATGRPIVIGFMGGYHGEAGTAGAIGAETSDLSFGYRALMPGFAHVPYPNAYRTPFTARPGGTGDGTVDYIRDHSCITRSSARGGGVRDRARARQRWVRRPARRVLDRPRRSVPRVRLPPLRRRGEVGVRTDGTPVRRRTVGRATRPDGAGQGDGRRRDPDRRRARYRAGDGLRRRVHRIDVVVAAGGVRGRAGDVRIFRDEPILEHVRELDAVARRALAPLQERYACIGDVRVTGCFIAIEFVKDRVTKERDLELMERVALGCLNRGLLVDASTTSMNLQPSLVTPVDVLERGIAIVDEAIAEALGSPSA